MRILQSVDADLTQPGGVETHVRELSTELIARGHEVTVAARPAARAVDDARSARGPTTTDAPDRTALPPDPRSFDVVHHHLGALPAGFRESGRCVRTVHVCAAAKVEAYVRIGRLQTLLNPRNYGDLRDERDACRHARELIVVSERLRRDLSRFHGLDPARARVIPNGVRFGAARESRAALRARYGVPDQAPVLIAIGRDDFVKGFGLLEKAWRRAGAGGRGAWWVVVGGGAPHAEPGRVVTGPVPHEQVTSWIQAADFGAAPSYYEGCGLALLEMLAGGLFACTHDVGIASEVIRSGRNGRLVPQTVDAWVETLRALLDRPPGRDPEALSREFAWENVAERIESVYRRVAETPAA